MMEADGFVSREQIEQVQQERLPQVATRALLHLRPKQVLEEQTMIDAIELSSADVVESGRDFASLTDGEKADILTRNYAHCLERNMRFLAKMDAL